MIESVAGHVSRAMLSRYRLFRQRNARAAKDLDSLIRLLKAKREATINALLAHQADHWVKQIPLRQMQSKTRSY